MLFDEFCDWALRKGLDLEEDDDPEYAAGVRPPFYCDPGPNLQPSNQVMQTLPNGEVLHNVRII